MNELFSVEQPVNYSLSKVDGQGENDRQRAFVFSKYIKTGVEDLDQEKLSHLLQLK